MKTTELQMVAIADRVLESMYRPGKPAPTTAELRAAYPFESRTDYSSQIWKNRVRACPRAHAAGERRPPSQAKRIEDPAKWDGATLPIFEGA
jgi:hypothetical protein